MGRMYSRKKGSSGSTKFAEPKKHIWIAHDAKVVEQLVVKFAKAGKSASEIGIHMRDSYGIPDIHAVLKKPLATILSDNGIKKEIPDDLRALIKRDVAIMKHRELNKKDMTAKRGQQLTESKIQRLVKYYKKQGTLPGTWVYERAKASQWVT